MGDNWEDRVMKLSELRKEITAMKKDLMKPVSKMKRADLLDHYKHLKSLNLGAAKPSSGKKEKKVAEKEVPSKKSKKIVESESESSSEEEAPRAKSRKPLAVLRYEAEMKKEKEKEKAKKSVKEVPKKSKKIVEESDSDSE